MLDEWLKRMFRPSDQKPMADLIEAFKRVRKNRQKPAHSLKANEFDQTYFHDQRDLIIAAYTAVRTIRLIFVNHPAVRIATLDIPDVIYEGKIWTY
ncbi:MAG: hypothetical protein SVV80_10830 [Planctomycetota bacterium]|nr:hypothetical protein [Planctomycetota bacterium]